MIAALLLATASPTAIDAERAFAADAQKLGQWTAFRKWAAENALMFTPQPVEAHDFLKDRADPPVAVFWWPGRSYVSCDGTVAINTGPWVREWGKSVGYFTTVWRRQADSNWKWIYDAGEALAVPRAEGGDIKPTVAFCGGGPPPAPVPELEPDVQYGGGESPDRSIRWNWSVGADGRRSFRAWVWTGTTIQLVIDDQVAPPQ